MASISWTLMNYYARVVCAGGESPLNRIIKTPLDLGLVYRLVLRIVGKGIADRMNSLVCISTRLLCE